jgi:hypothetical protein
MPRGRGGSKGASAAKPAGGAAAAAAPAASAKPAAKPAAAPPPSHVLPPRAETPSSDEDEEEEEDDSGEGEWETGSDEEYDEYDDDGDEDGSGRAAHEFTVTALRAASVHLVDDTEAPQQCAPVCALGAFSRTLTTPVFALFPPTRSIALFGSQLNARAKLDGWQGVLRRRVTGVSAEMALARAHAATGLAPPSVSALKTATRAHARLTRALARRPARDFHDVCDDGGATSDADSVDENFQPSAKDAAAADADAANRDDDDGGVDGCGGFGIVLRHCATPLTLVCFTAGWRYTPSYEGELLACVNVRRGRLELRLLRTRAALTAHQTAVLDKAPSPDAAKLATEVLLPAFELSRQLRVDIALSAVSAVHVGDPGVGGPTRLRVLTLDLSAPPRFATRRLRAASSVARAWRRRGDFTPAGAAAASSRIQLVASDGDIAALAALLQVTEPRLAALLRASVGKLLPPAPRAFRPAAAAAPAAAASAPTQQASLPADVAMRRAGILALLLQERLITAEAAAVPPSAASSESASKSGAHKKSSSKTPLLNNHLAHLADAAGLITPCFAHYLNCTCTGADALRTMLATRVHVPEPSSDEDEGEHEEEEEETQAREPARACVADALRGPALLGNRDLFFSFCQEAVVEKDYTFHCTTCAKCSFGREGDACPGCRVRRPRWVPPAKHAAAAAAAAAPKKAAHTPLSAHVAAMCGFGGGAEEEEDDCYYGGVEYDSDGEPVAKPAAPKEAAQSGDGAQLPMGASDSEEDVVEWPGGGGVAGAPPRDERTQAQRAAEARAGGANPECPVQ